MTLTKLATCAANNFWNLSLSQADRFASLGQRELVRARAQSSIIFLLCDIRTRLYHSATCHLPLTSAA